MSVFRYKKSVPVEYDLQGYIYFYSQMYRLLSVREQREIEGVCREAAGEHAQAVLEAVTSDAGAASICRRHYLSASTLERAVRRYYVKFAQRLKG